MSKSTNDTRVVWKFDLPLTDHPAEPATIELPFGAQIRKVAEQGTVAMGTPRLCLWALVNPEEQRKEIREVYTAGTGHVFASTVTKRGTDYTETLFALDGRLVLHVWISPPLRVR